jgi:hypothetical protein
VAIDINIRSSPSKGNKKKKMTERNKILEGIKITGSQPLIASCQVTLLHPTQGRVEDEEEEEGINGKAPSGPE